MGSLVSCLNDLFPTFRKHSPLFIKIIIFSLVLSISILISTICNYYIWLFCFGKASAWGIELIFPLYGTPVLAIIIHLMLSFSVKSKYLKKIEALSYLMFSLKKILGTVVLSIIAFYLILGLAFLNN